MNDYETDVVLWSDRQANLLRRVAAGEPVEEPLDWFNIAEEIEAVGRLQRCTLRGLIDIVIEYLMRLQAASATDPKRGWQETILHSRRDIRKLLKDSPSLRRLVSDLVQEETICVRQEVAQILALYGETPTVDLNTLAYTEEQVLGDWFPV